MLLVSFLVVPGQLVQLLNDGQISEVNDGLFQANASKMFVNDGEMLVNVGELSVWLYSFDHHDIHKHFTIISEHFTSISLK